MNYKDWLAGFEAGKMAAQTPVGRSKHVEMRPFDLRAILRTIVDADSHAEMADCAASKLIAWVEGRK